MKYATPCRILLIGTNPRNEAPVLNSRIRKAWINGAKVARIGVEADLTYDVHQLGTGRAALAELAAQDHTDKHGSNGVMIIGQAAISGADGAAVLATAKPAHTSTAKARQSGPLFSATFISGREKLAMPCVACNGSGTYQHAKPMVSGRDIIKSHPITAICSPVS